MISDIFCLSSDINKIYKNSCNLKGGKPNDTREIEKSMHKERLKREKQTYISEQLKGWRMLFLSRFKAGKIEFISPSGERGWKTI